MKLRLRSSVIGNARLGLTLGVTMAALVGCSDDDAPPPVIEVDAAVSSGTTDVPGPIDTTGASGGNESSAPTPNETSGSPDTLTVGASGTSDPGGDLTSGWPTGPATETADTADTGEQTTGVAGSSQPPNESSAPSTDTGAPPSTDDTGSEDGAIAPPGNMIVISNFDSAAGFPDGQHNLPANHVRTYANSMMTLEAVFTDEDQQTGVNFNFTADICGYDVLARIRRRSGTVAGGLVQMRVWSDVWGQFASQSGTFGAVGAWEEYRVTWSQVVAENSDLNINAINAVGFALMPSGAVDAVFDVDWIGLVPSETPCPSVDTGSTGDVSSTPTIPDVDSGVVDPGDGGLEPLPNLVTNGGFEVDTTGWGTWGSGVTLTASTDKARTGDQSLLVSGGSGVGPARTIINNPVPGGVYEVTFWASTADDPAQVRIVGNLACLDNQYPWIVGNTQVTSDGWTELTGTLTVPEDCDSTSFQVYAEGGTAGVDVYLDDVSVTLISAPGETTEPGATTAPDVVTSEPAVTSEEVVTTDEEGETTAVVDGSDASVDETTEIVDGPDASVSEEPTSEPVETSAPVETSVLVDTTIAMETSAPADTTVVDETSAPADPYGADIITNGNFETGSWWWYASPGNPVTIAQTTAQAHGGTGSLLTTGRTANWHGPALNLLAGGVTQAITQGSTYFVQAYVRLNGSASDNIGLSISQTCDSVNGFPAIDSATVTNTEWTLLEGTFTVPTCTSLSAFALYAQSSTSTTVEFYIDDVSIRQVLP